MASSTPPPSRYGLNRTDERDKLKEHLKQPAVAHIDRQYNLRQRYWSRAFRQRRVLTIFLKTSCMHDSCALFTIGSLCPAAAAATC